MAEWCACGEGVVVAGPCGPDEKLLYANMLRWATGDLGRQGKDMNDKTELPDGARRATNGNGSGDALGTNSAIGQKLKQYYDELVSDEVPDRFASLLKQLEDSENSAGQGGGKQR